MNFANNSEMFLDTEQTVRYVFIHLKTTSYVYTINKNLMQKWKMALT